MKVEKVESLLAFRCNEELRSELRKVSARLGVVDSAVARVALREGLRIVGAKGLQPAPEATELS